MDDEDIDGFEAVPSYPWSWSGMACSVLAYASDMAATTASFLATTSRDLAALNNHKIDQRNFHEAAALEIESMTTEEG